MKKGTSVFMKVYMTLVVLVAIGIFIVLVTNCKPGKDELEKNIKEQSSSKTAPSKKVNTVESTQKTEETKSSSAKAAKKIDKKYRLPGKKGIGFCLRDPNSAQEKKRGGTWDKNMPKIKALDVSWNYSWGPTHVPNQADDIEFLPMIWGAWNKDKLKHYLETIVVPDIKAGKTKMLLVFNEPDKKDQANMPYKRAIKFWPEFEKLGIPLCSPACANPEGIKDDSAQGVPGTWMRDFVKEADKRGYRMDYIGVHWYGGGSFENFKNKMRRIYEKYGRRPLLITEFAPADWKAKSPAKNKHKPEKVLRFMKQALPWMEKQDWIAGYAWFPFDIDSRVGNCSALFDKKGNLTACGRYYKSITPENPRGDQSIKPDPPHHR